MPQANKQHIKKGLGREYYCSENLYIKLNRPTKIDTIPTSKVSTTICPKTRLSQGKKQMKKSPLFCCSYRLPQSHKFQHG